MRSSVTSESDFPHPPILTDRPHWPQEPGRRPSAGVVPAGQALRYDIAGDDSMAGGPVRVRLVDVTRGRRLAADDVGRHVSDDPLAWLDGTQHPGSGA
jgi:hypothetical protein